MLKWIVLVFFIVTIGLSVYADRSCDYQQPTMMLIDNQVSEFVQCTVSHVIVMQNGKLVSVPKTTEILAYPTFSAETR